MIHFPSCRPSTHKPSNKYAYNRKTCQALAIHEAQEKKRQAKILAQNTIETINLCDLYIDSTACILDLSIPELEQLLSQY
jgi:hypothetical protein